MNLRRVALAHVFLFLYVTSDGFVDLALRLALWSVVLFIVFKDKLLPKLGQLSNKFTKVQQKIVTRLNTLLSDFSTARIVKTLLGLKVLLFFTWLLPQWLIVFVLVEAWAFKDEIRPYRHQLKEKIRGTARLAQEKIGQVLSQIPKYTRVHL